MPTQSPGLIELHIAFIKALLASSKFCVLHMYHMGPQKSHDAHGLC